MRCPVRSALLLALLALTGCGGDDPSSDPAVAAAARALLDGGDANGALVAARRALAEGSTSPEVRLVAARACLQLERWGDALTHAAAGLDAGATGDLAADLRWAEGSAAARRYAGTRDEQDWRLASASFQEAVGAGSHRADAAAQLTWLHAVAKPRDLERVLKYGRLCLSLSPDEKTAQDVRDMLTQLGLEP